MSTKTDYIVNNDNYTNKDLYDIFQPIEPATETITTGYKVNNQYFQNKDLGEIFLGYTSGGTKANDTGYEVNGSDLANIIAPISLVPSFTFTQVTQGTQPTIETLTVSGSSISYYMMKFTTTNVNTTYKFYPNSSIKVYQLFVVSGGENGGSGGINPSPGGSGGKGGQVLFYNNTSFITYTSVSGGSSNDFTLSVGTGANSSTSSLSNTSVFTFTANPTDGSSSSGTRNIFTNYVYGSPGGNGGDGVTARNTFNSQAGGGGGGGGGGNDVKGDDGTSSTTSGTSPTSGTVDTLGIGGNGGTNGGSGGNAGKGSAAGRGSENNPLSVDGVLGSGIGGGAGGLRNADLLGGGGGGGGGAGEYGGGGGGGGGRAAGGGGGGSGVILLIFTA